MTIHSIIVAVEDDLNPAHFLAAVRHWLSKFEQEIMHKDEGPDATGAYHFEHDGKATTVAWEPTPDAVVPEAPAPALVDEPGPIDPEASEVAPPSEAAAAFALAASMDPEPAPTPAEPTEAAEHAAAQPDSTAADAHAAVAPDAA